MSSTTVKILYCHCAYAQVVPKAVKEQVLRQLVESGVAFDSVADLCEMSAKGDPMLKQLCELEDQGAGESIKIAACYPRAVRWLFSAADVNIDRPGIEVLNMRTESAEKVIFAILGEGFGSVPAEAAQSKEST